MWLTCCPAPCAPLVRVCAAVFLHNRFAGGGTLPPKQRSRFEPARVSIAQAMGVVRVVERPVYIAADLHSNFGHNALDSVFPLMANLLRLRASLADAERGSGGERDGGERDGGPPLSRELAARLPDPATGNFTFLLYDSPVFTGKPKWHLGAKERAWTSTFAGSAGRLTAAGGGLPGWLRAAGRMGRCRPHGAVRG